jgi:putative transposase
MLPIAERARRGNSRNGKSAKTIQTETGAYVIEVPRDRNGAFAPQLVATR